jgi:hypothetical protein
LPPASQINLTNHYYPLSSWHVDYQAEAYGFLDLKSQALLMLLPQLGLAPPTRNIYVVHNLEASMRATFGTNFEVYGFPACLMPGYVSGDITNFVSGFNFDPTSLKPSPYINDELFDADITYDSYGQFKATPLSEDPGSYGYSAVADGSLGWGGFYTGLTWDDVGGLCCLLSTNNIRYETLLNDIRGRGINSFVNGAWRPGVDKITFVLQPSDAMFDRFVPRTIPFTDTYISNGIAIHQTLVRVAIRPDFLFSAGNDTFCTGTTNWINNSALNRNPTGAGPGVIRPQVVITFQKAGKSFASFSSEDSAQDWPDWDSSVQDWTTEFATFAGSASTYETFIYPVRQTGKVSLSVRVLLNQSNQNTNSFKSFEWSATSQAGTVYALQTSTNLAKWHTLFVVTNNGSICSYHNAMVSSSARFYRLTPQ